MNQVVFANYGHFLWKTFNLKVFMFSNSNPDFPDFFNAVASKLNSYNGIDDTFDDNYIQRYATYSSWPNSTNSQFLSLLIAKYKSDTGNDFCGDIMSPTYLLSSANDPKRMCIFLTSESPGDSHPRLHSAATVYFSNKFQKTGNSDASVLSFRRDKVLNIEAICAAPKGYVTHNGGRKMMTLLIGASKQMANVKAMYLNAIDVAGTLNFYKSLGFGETGEFDDEGNIEHTLQILPEFDVLTKILLAKRAAKKWKQMLSKDSRENQIIEIWSAEDEEQLDALGGVFGKKTGVFGFGKRTRSKKRKSKKRKSKGQNSKTRVRVF